MEKANNNAAARDYVLIRAGQHSLTEEIRELRKYKDLIRMFVIREFAVRYKQTILGPMWILLRPFVTSLAHLFIFNRIAHIQTDGVPGILYYLGSNEVWGYFSTSLSSNANTFRDNAGLFGKIYFPRLTMPIAHVLIAGIQFLIEMLLFGGFYLYYALHGEVSGNPVLLLTVPLVLLHLGILGLSCGVILSSVTTKYRDLSIVVSFGVQLWMYATPVVYPLSSLAESSMRFWILLNPVTQPMELFRLAVFGKGMIVPWSLAVSAALTVLLAFGGLALFTKVEKTFIDTV